MYLAQKAIDPNRMCNVLPQHLDRDHAVVLDVVSEIYGCHTAMAELALDSIASVQVGGKAGRCVSQYRVCRMSRRERRNATIDPSDSRSVATVGTYRAT